MTAPRGTAARVLRLRQSLSELDTETLRSIERLRLLTTAHVQRLHMANGSPTTRPRRTRALLRRLTDLGLAARLPRDIGGRQAGSHTAMYCLSRLGQAVLIPSGRSPRQRMLWQVKPYFHDHLLAVSDLYVRLVETCRSSDTELLGFQPEPACWRQFAGSGGQSITLKPDAYVRVGVGDYEVSSFVEVDLGTESRPTISRKCRTYVNYWRTGLEQQRHGVFPRVVWLVSNKRRRDGLAEVIRRLPGGGQQLFTVALTEDGPNVLTTPPASRSSDGGAA